MTYLRQVAAIVAKDAAIEWRTRDAVGTMVVFSLIIMLTFSFAFDLRADNQVSLAPGVLWVAITFAGTLGLSRSFAVERDRGAIDSLLLAPVDRSAVYLGKMLANVGFLFLVELIVVPVFVVLFGLSNFNAWALIGVVALGTLGLAVIGTLVSAIAIHSRAREVSLSVLLFPLLVPVILCAVKLTAAVLDHIPFAEVQHWLALLVAVDAIFLSLSAMLFDYVIED